MSDVILGEVVVDAVPNLANGQITYTLTAQGAAGIVRNKVVPVNEIQFDLKPGIADPVVPGSVMFTWNGLTYVDRSGKILHSISNSTGAGSQVGTIDYDTGIVTLNQWPSNSSGALTVLALATTDGKMFVVNMTFRTAGAPIRPGGLQIYATANDGRTLSATANFNGIISGDGIHGNVDQLTGVVNIIFCDDPTDEASINASLIYVSAPSVKYNCVVYTSVPLDADLIGLDPVRLPSDGRVPIFRSGDIAVLNNWAEMDIGTPTSGQVITLPRDHLAEVVIEDGTGKRLAGAQYTEDREAGTITMGNPLELKTLADELLTPPLVAKHRIEHMSLVSDVQISGVLTLVSPLGHAYPKDETTVSSAVVYGDLQARVWQFFSQKSFSLSAPVWSDTLIGETTTAQYNRIDNPIEISNRGAISERWVLVFTSSTSFQIIGESIGVIGTGVITADTAPINPNTLVPYFAVRAAGWGTGWATGNAIRFNTDSALAPLWCARVTTAGPASADNDSFSLQIRGDAD